MKNALAQFEALIKAIDVVGTQTALARECDVSVTTVWKWVKSAKRVSAEYVLRVEASRLKKHQAMILGRCRCSISCRPFSKIKLQQGGYIHAPFPFPFPDKAADVIESMSWAELINGALLISIAMILLPLAVLMFSARAGWA